MYQAEQATLDAFSSESRLDPDFGRVTKGLSSCNDERFVFLFWEIDLTAHRWRYCAKGSDYLWFVSNIHTVVDWLNDGEYIASYVSSVSSNVAQARRSSRYYFRPGATYTYRCDDFSLRAIPAGCVFTNAAPVIIPNDPNELPGLFAAFFSEAYEVLLSQISKKGKYDTGRLRLLPVPASTEHEDLGRQWRDITRYIVGLESQLETTPYFVCTQNGESCFRGDLFREKVNRFVTSSGHEVSVSFLDAAERLLMQRYDALTHSYPAYISYLLGSAFLRWDIRLAQDPTLAPDLADPFDPLPVCPPGMLIGPDGLPAKPRGIVSEEWLRARPNAITLPPEGSVSDPTIVDSDYPLRFSWNGILVDDTGTEGDYYHPDDIIGRVREVLDLLWGEKADAIEQEACEILNVSSLRDYFRKPTGFFQDHLKRYSKSRRKAPIYWPLSTPTGSYTVWLYYHRLTDQTLYTVINKYVEPKISEIERYLARIEEGLSSSGRESTKLRDKLNNGQGFLGELQEFREEVLRIAALPYKPNLNDGVIINASPLCRLFRHRQWSLDTEDCWKKLENGDYDWSHLAYTIWPDRVRGACKTDRSIAIAHDLEDLCEVEAAGKRNQEGRGRLKKETGE